MKRWILAFVSLAALGALVRPAAAQEPSGATLILSETAPGAYQMEVRNAASIAPFVVKASVFEIGSDNGVIVDLEESNATELTFDLALPLDGMREGGCYRVGFFARKQDGAMKPGGPFEGAGPALETRACVDGGVVTFPAYDSVTSPAPAAPSEVRLVRVPESDYPSAGGDTWTIEWTDNSVDEISFGPRITLFDGPDPRTANVIETMVLPEVPRDQTQFGSIGFLFAPDGPPETVCGYALVQVFAIGRDSPNDHAGSTTVLACFGYGTISFPALGVGLGARNGVDHRDVLMLIGAVCIAAGAALQMYDRRRAGA